MLDCREVAKYFINRAYQDGRDTDMTNMKVQKLLYYAQSLHLALFDETLFNRNRSSLVPFYLPLDYPSNT